MDKFINKVIQGDCLIKLKELEDNSVDSIVTDPPFKNMESKLYYIPPCDKQFEYEDH